MANAVTDVLLNSLAHKIALSTIKSDIESCCPAECIDGDVDLWYDPSELEGHERQMVSDAIQFAELKGLLDRHPVNTRLVRIKLLQVTQSGKKD